MWVILALAVAMDASEKDVPPFPVFIVSLFLGFPLPLLLVALAPDRAKQPVTGMSIAARSRTTLPVSTSTERLPGESDREYFSR